MESRGRITFWDDDKGYGFISPDEAGGERVFVHVSAFEEGSRRPARGRGVVFESGHDKQGRLRAESARLTGMAIPGPASWGRFAKRPGGRAVLLALVFLAGLTGLVAVGRLPVWVPAACLALSVVTFVLYALDKAAAQKPHARRTPENTLHLMALLGGWPGAMVAQQTLRHKSQKRRFRLVFWLTVSINLGALTAWFWWLTL